MCNYEINFSLWIYIQNFKVVWNLPSLSLAWFFFNHMESRTICQMKLIRLYLVRIVMISEYLDDYPERLKPSVILRSTHWTPQHCAVAVVAWARFDTTSTAGFTCFLFFHPLWLSFYFILPPSLFPFFFYVLTVGVFDWFCPNIRVFLIKISHFRFSFIKLFPNSW